MMNEGNAQQYKFDVKQPQQPMPLCQVHARLEDQNKLLLTYGHSCVACSLNERQEFLSVLEAAVPENTIVDAVTFLAQLIPTPERVEDYIRSLQWSTDTTESEKTLVAGNIRGFATHLRQHSTQK